MTQPDPAAKPDLDPIDATDRARWSGPALAEAAAVCGRWGLSLTSVIGAAEAPRGGLSSVALHRIGALIGIDHALTVALGVDQGRVWLHQPNAGPAFGGHSPAMVIQRGGLPGLLAVRGFLDAMKVAAFAYLDPSEEAPAIRLQVIQ